MFIVQVIQLINLHKVVSHLSLNFFPVSAQIVSCVIVSLKLYGHLKRLQLNLINFALYVRFLKGSIDKLLAERFPFLVGQRKVSKLRKSRRLYIGHETRKFPKII